MTPLVAPIGIAKTARGLRITLPGRFWLLVSLRRAVKRLVAHEEAWTYLAPESKALRIEQWVAEVDSDVNEHRPERFTKVAVVRLSIGDEIETPSLLWAAPEACPSCGRAHPKKVGDAHG